MKKESARTIEYSVNADSFGLRLSKFLKNKGYPEGCLSKLRHEDNTTFFNGETVHMNFIFREPGTLKVIIRDNETSEKVEAVKLPIDVVYEDEDIIIINKPAFMPTHPSLNNYRNTLANALAYYLSEKGETIVFRCINRLDRDTTGLTIVAKHYLSAGILSEMMQNRQIRREYVGIVSGEIVSDGGTVDAPIGRVPGSTIERTVDFENGERAVTHFKVLDRKNNATLVRFNLETGRTHQIRVHMKYLGTPLVGDFLYNPNDTGMNRQALHGGYLVFTHPITGKTMDFSVPLPKDMTDVWERNQINGDLN